MNATLHQFAQPSPQVRETSPDWAGMSRILPASILNNDKRVQRVQRAETRKLVAIAAGFVAIQASLDEEQLAVFNDSFDLAMRG
jgi:hypothetical protein